MNQSDHKSKQHEKNYQNELLKYVHAERNKLITKSEYSSSSTSELSKSDSFCISSDDNMRINSEFKSFQLRYAKIVKENSKLLNDVQNYRKYQHQMETNLQKYYQLIQNANEKLIKSENTHMALEEHLNKFVNIAKQQILGKLS